MVNTQSVADLISPTDKKVKQPNFFIVGAPKCGTTSMYYYLQKHPDIFMSVPKEPLYFGSDLDCHRLKTREEEEYLSFFTGGAKHKRVGEASTWYLYSEKAAREIKEFAPNAKIIVMLRRIPEAMYALHSQYLYTGNEVVESFEKALALEEERKQGRRIPEGSYFPEGLLYSRVYRYAEQIKRYFDVFGRENVLIITLDDLKQDVEAVYRRTLQFLGLREFPSVGFERYNSNGRFRSQVLQELVRKVSGETKRRLRDLIPVRPCMNAWQKLEPVLVENFSRPPLSESLREQLREQTAPEVKKLNELLDRDFTGWLEYE